MTPFCRADLWVCCSWLMLVSSQKSLVFIFRSMLSYSFGLPVARRGWRVEQRVAAKTGGIKQIWHKRVLCQVSTPWLEKTNTALWVAQRAGGMDTRNTAGCFHHGWFIILHHFFLGCLFPMKNPNKQTNKLTKKHNSCQRAANSCSSRHHPGSEAADEEKHQRVNQDVSLPVVGFLTQGGGGRVSRGGGGWLSSPPLRERWSFAETTKASTGFISTVGWVLPEPQSTQP